MRHLAASEAGALARPLVVRVFGWVDGRGLWGLRVTQAIARAWEQPTKATMTKIPPARKPAKSACGRVVASGDICRDTWRRSHPQALAPIPDFCSPDCDECAVILDAVESMR